MHHLIVPFPHTRFHIDRDERIAEEIVAGAMSAVFIHQRHADRDVDEAKFRICGIGGPWIVLADTFAANLGAVFPCFGTEFARLRNEVEFPELTPRVHIEAAHKTGNVVHANWVVAVNRRIADHDHAVHDDSRRTGGDLPIRWIDADCAIRTNALHRIPRLARLRFASGCCFRDDQRAGVIDRQRHHRKAQSLLQIDDAIDAEVRIRQARARVERHHVITRRDDDHAFVLAVGPIRWTATGELSRRLLPANPLVEAIHPERLAGFRIDRHHGTTRRGNGENSAIRIQRRGAIVLVGPEGSGVPLPRHLQLAEIIGRDLIEWRVACAVRVATPVSPFTRRVAAHQRRHARRGATGRTRWSHCRSRCGSLCDDR